MAATLNAGSPGPVATSRTESSLPIPASSISACVIGVNIPRIISRCFSQNGAEPFHRFMISWSGCMGEL